MACNSGIVQFPRLSIRRNGFVSCLSVKFMFCLPVCPPDEIACQALFYSRIFSSEDPERLAPTLLRTVIYFVTQDYDELGHTKARLPQYQYHRVPGGKIAHTVIDNRHTHHQRPTPAIVSFSSAMCVEITGWYLPEHPIFENTLICF